MLGRAHTKKSVGLLNVSSTHLKTLFDAMLWSLQRNRGVVKPKIYTIKHPQPHSFFGMTTNYHQRRCLNV
jgi:hypothetical protein